MEDQLNRSPVAQMRTAFATRSASSDERVASSEELIDDTQTEAPSAPSRRRKAADVNTANQFNGALVPAQFKLPADLVQSLKLHSISSGETMSEIVLRCMTTADLIEKAWISTRRAS